jgi:hypothetical protein
VYLVNELYIDMRLKKVRFEIWFCGENESCNAEFVLNDDRVKGMSFFNKELQINVFRHALLKPFPT